MTDITVLPNPRQEKFALEYVLDGNATRAAREAGYKGTDAAISVTGSRLVKNAKVAKRIAELRTARNERTHVNIDRVVQELAAIAFADLGNYAEWDGDKVTLKPSQHLTPIQRSAITEVVRTADGQVRIKLADKNRAIELLGKHLGMFTGETPQQQGATYQQIDARSLHLMSMQFGEKLPPELLEALADAAREMRDMKKETK